ncbi:MAG: hypothetical protein AAF720_13930 [Pseudomonadota bacterium]
MTKTEIKEQKPASTGKPDSETVSDRVDRPEKVDCEPITLSNPITPSNPMTLAPEDKVFPEPQLPSAQRYTEHFDASPKGPKGATIEGGIDAIVIGASLDGMAAAALLAKAGLRTIVIESGFPMIAAEPEEFTAQFYCDPGDSLSFGIDPALLQRIDLHRHGLRFAERRMETTYYATGGKRLIAPGDLAEFANLEGDLTDRDRRRADLFIEEIQSLSQSLVPYFETGNTEAQATDTFNRWALSSLEETLSGVFDEEVLTSIFATEALRFSARRPDSPMTSLSLIRRYSGEIAGLQSSIGAIDRGLQGLSRSIKRTLQTLGVDYRHASEVSRVLVEWDRVQGVEFTNGGQLRAPIVVSCFDPDTAFLKHAGRDHLDIEFVRALESRAPQYTTLVARIAFDAKPDGPLFNEDYRRRVIRLASLATIKKCFTAARLGDFHDDAPAELFFPSAFHSGLAPTDGAVAIMRSGPAPLNPKPGRVFKDWEADAKKHALSILTSLDETAAQSVRSVEVTTETSSDVILREAEIARFLANAGGLKGYFYCGSGMRIGSPGTGAAGRRAADTALQYHKQLQSVL